MKIFSTSQVRQLDQYTIQHEPVASIDLMERAADALFEAYTEIFPKGKPVLIFAGPGNNGGDALALARKLLKLKVDVSVVLLHNGKLSADGEDNKQRLLSTHPEVITESIEKLRISQLKENTIIVDGLFGSGLSRPLEGIFAEAVNWINQSGYEVLSIDIPSGLQGEKNENLEVPIVKASHTFSLQFPKLAFLLPETASFVGDWTVLNINIHPDAISTTSSNYHLLTKNDLQPHLLKRQKFTHKGDFGHVLIFAGSKDMAGAAILSAKAALRTGAGLVTVHSAASNRVILQSAVPEVIFQSDSDEQWISETGDPDMQQTIAVGPGIRVNDTTTQFLKTLLTKQSKPMILDADALNIIGQNKAWLNHIPEKSILTPHPKEFERLFGPTANSYERMNLASEISQEKKLILILKGAHTEIFLPDGNIIFNSTGNPGMSTAGSGDVLTGMLAALLAQNYQPETAALLGVFLHGMSADLALNTQTMETLIASDIIDFLPKAFKILQKTN